MGRQHDSTRARCCHFPLWQQRSGCLHVPFFCGGGVPVPVGGSAGRCPAETCPWKPAVPRAAGASFPRVVWQCFLINSLGFLGKKILKTLQRREVSSLARSRLSCKALWLSRTLGADVGGSMAVLRRSWGAELRRRQASGGRGGCQRGVDGEHGDGRPCWRNGTGSCRKLRWMTKAV